MALAVRTSEPRTRLALVHSATDSSESEAVLSESGTDFSAGSAEPSAGSAEPSAPERGDQGQGPLSERTLAFGSRSPKKEELSSVAALLERDDAELVVLARAGQPHAFEALYRRHSSYALALAVRVQGNTSDAEDVVHDAFLRAHDRLDHLRADSSFRPWLSSVVVSLVRTRMRRRRMLGVLGLSTSEPIDLDALVTPEAGPEVRAQLAQVYTVLRSVSVDQRICWTLRFVEGRKLEDVAEMADCSLATAKRRIAAVQHQILLSNLRGFSDESVLDESASEAQDALDGCEADLGDCEGEHEGDIK